MITYERGQCQGGIFPYDSFKIREMEKYNYPEYPEKLLTIGF